MTSGCRNLFIDIETIGFPEKLDYNNYHDPTKFKNIHYYDNARIIEIGFMIYDENNNIVKSYSSLIKLDNFTIKNSSIHGITDDDCNKDGIDFKDVLNELIEDVDKYDNIIAHNISFDYNILLSEIYRVLYDTSSLSYENILLDFLNNFINKNKLCTMEIGRVYMKTKKNPKLTELYQHLFKNPIVQDHRALSDTAICSKCYYKMIGVYENMFI
jgi:DNA polymerase III epsilon subunit-like protein